MALPELMSTGVPGFDKILGGGLPRKRVYLAQGEPGTGKTTLGLQFLLEGAKQGESTLLITLSETKEEIYAVASGRGAGIARVEFSADGVPFGTATSPPFHARFDPAALSERTVRINASAVTASGATADFMSPVRVNGEGAPCEVPAP